MFCFVAWHPGNLQASSLLASQTHEWTLLAAIVCYSLKVFPAALVITTISLINAAQIPQGHLAGVRKCDRLARPRLGAASLFCMLPGKTRVARLDWPHSPALGETSIFEVPLCRLVSSSGANSESKLPGAIMVCANDRVFYDKWRRPSRADRR